MGAGHAVASISDQSEPIDHESVNRRCRPWRRRSSGSPTPPSPAARLAPSIRLGLVVAHVPGGDPRSPGQQLVGVGRRRGGSADRDEGERRCSSSKQTATRPSRRIDLPLIVSAEVMNTSRASSPSPSTSTQTGATWGDPSSRVTASFPSGPAIAPARTRCHHPSGAAVYPTAAYNQRRSVSIPAVPDSRPAVRALLRVASWANPESDDACSGVGCWRRRRELNPGTRLCRPLHEPLCHVAEALRGYRRCRQSPAECARHLCRDTTRRAGAVPRRCVTVGAQPRSRAAGRGSNQWAVPNCSARNRVSGGSSARRSSGHTRSTTDADPSSPRRGARRAARIRRRRPHRCRRSGHGSAAAHRWR